MNGQTEAAAKQATPEVTREAENVTKELEETVSLLESQLAPVLSIPPAADQGMTPRMEMTTPLGRQLQEQQIRAMSINELLGSILRRLEV